MIRRRRAEHRCSDENTEDPTDHNENPVGTECEQKPVPVDYGDEIARDGLNQVGVGDGGTGAEIEKRSYSTEDRRWVVRVGCVDVEMNEGDFDHRRQSLIEKSDA